MNNLSIVFDTNAYRDLCGGTSIQGGWSAGALRGREAPLGITAFANPFVVMELASHLWDSSDPDYAECRCGLRSLFEHCQVGTEPAFRLVAPSESLIAKILYDKEIPDNADTTEKLAKLAHLVASAPAGALGQGIADSCKEIADYLSDREDLFVSDMQAIIFRMNPAATHWNPFDGDKAGRQKCLREVQSSAMLWHISLGHVLKVRRLLRMPDSDPSLKKDADNVLEVCGASMSLYREILERLVSTGCDVSKQGRANWLWDMQIAFAIGQEFGDPPQPMTLVTGDKAIVEAANAASIDNHVVGLAEYLASI